MSKNLISVIALAIVSTFANAQGSFQGTVRITGSNGNIISLSSGTPNANYTITLPPAIPTTGSLLYGHSNGQLKWCNATTADTGYILQMRNVDGVMTPTWVHPNTLSIRGGDAFNETSEQMRAMQRAPGADGYVVQSTNTGAVKWAESGGSEVGKILYARKPADESVFFDANLQDDDHLTFTVNANETWEINGEINAYSEEGNADIKVALEIPAAATMNVMYTGIGGNAIQGNDILTTSNDAQVVGITGGKSTLISFRGTITTDGSGGPVKFRWSQGSPDHPATVVRSGSYMKLIRVQ